MIWASHDINFPIPGRRKYKARNIRPMFIKKFFKTFIPYFFGSINKSSTLHPRVFEIFKARTVEGTYIPFSIALMLFLETSAFSDSSCWVKPASFLSSSRLFKSFLWFLPKIISFRSLQLHWLILRLCSGKDSQQLSALNQ